MIPLLGKLLRWIFWGPPRKRAWSQEPTPLDVGSGRIMGWTYGEVVTDVYLNRNQRGQPYFKVAFRRLVKDGRHASKSFLIDDLKDIERGIARARAWVYDSKIV